MRGAPPTGAAAGESPSAGFAQKFAEDISLKAHADFWASRPWRFLDPV